MSPSLDLWREDERPSSLKKSNYGRRLRHFSDLHTGHREGRSGQARKATRRHLGTAVALCWGVLFACSSVAHAQSLTPSSSLTQELPLPELMQLEPEPLALELHATLGSSLPSDGVPRLGAELSYAHLPLRLSTESAQGTSLLLFALDGHLTGSMRVTEWLAAGLDVPVRLLQFSDDAGAVLVTGATPALAGMGDLRVQGQLLVLQGVEGQRPGVSVVPGIQLPTGSQAAWVGEGQVHISCLVATDYAMGPWYLAANVGYRHRPSPAMLGDVPIGSEILVRLGARLKLDASTALRAELLAQLPVGSAGQLAPEQVPVEVLLSAQRPVATATSPLRNSLWQTLSWTAGLGAGLGSGYGTPLLRATVGLRLSPRFNQDSDRDGLLDDADACPSQPEDLDQFQDADGCPELDNDADQLLDIADRCPLEPEDRDNFADEDGCPDPDNDQDGVLDAQDRCPQALEDLDKTLDGDGCPDPDNDKDLIPDTADACPDQAEDRDYFQDQDGCPELDNDADGIPDALDQCPDKAETAAAGAVAGAEQDGCPDKGGPVSTQPVPGEQLMVVGNGTAAAVTFAKNSARVSPESEELLHEIAKLLRSHPRLRVRIEAHTDDKGAAEHNLKLSQQRADALRKHLVEQENVPTQQLEAVGRGESQPLRDEATDEARSVNRRIEWWVLEPLP